MQFKSLLFAALCLLSVAACHNHDEEDTTAPTVTISSPAENEAVVGEVHLELTVADASLHELEVKVTKDSDGTELFKQTPTVHNESSYEFHAHFTPALAAETAVTLTVTVSDHNDNTTVKTLKFTAK